MLLQGCVTGAASSGIANDIFPAPQADFAAYRAAVRRYLLAQSMPHRTTADVELNLPFERQADPDSVYRGRFLLIHGLNDSPYVWHDFAERLAARGFAVRAVLLSGHGSTPRNMLNVHYLTWLKESRRHLDLWRAEGDALFIGGFSLGGVLATLLALDDANVDGLLLISPAYRSRLNAYLRWAGLYRRVQPWIFGGMILEDNPTKYNSIPVNSGWQFYRSTRLLGRRLRGRTIGVPTLMVLSENDSVVDTDYTRRVFARRFSHPRSRLLLYRPRGHPGSTTVDKTGENSVATFCLRSGEEVRQSQYRTERILNQSHLGLMYTADNPLFGRNGRILVCNGNEYPIFMACMRATGHWFGAQHTPSPDGTAVARTTYNPDFDTVMRRFDAVFTQRATVRAAAPISRKNAVQ